MWLARVGDDKKGDGLVGTQESKAELPEAGSQKQTGNKLVLSGNVNQLGQAGMEEPREESLLTLLTQ